MARATFVKSARKDYPDHGIKKGESYYWWKFRFGGKHFSKTPPKPSQLSGSEFLSQVYAITETLGELGSDDSWEDIRNAREEAVSELQNLADEQEDKLSNMPDALQEGETGQLLQGRADSAREMADELEGIDIPEGEDGDGDEDGAGDEDAEEGEEAKKEEVLAELQGVEYQGE